MRSILVAEDENLIRYSLSAALQDSDTRVVAFGNGRSALDALESSHFEFCFLDIQLPDMNGLDIMNTIRRTSPETRIIIMTGSRTDEETMDRIRRQAFLFLTKPFDLFRIKRVLCALSVDDPNTFHELCDLEAMHGTGEESISE